MPRRKNTSGVLLKKKNPEKFIEAVRMVEPKRDNSSLTTGVLSSGGIRRSTRKSSSRYARRPAQTEAKDSLGFQDVCSSMTETTDKLIPYSKQTSKINQKSQICSIPKTRKIQQIKLSDLNLVTLGRAVAKDKNFSENYHMKTHNKQKQSESKSDILKIDISKKPGSLSLVAAREEGLGIHVERSTEISLLSNRKKTEVFDIHDEQREYGSLPSATESSNGLQSPETVTKMRQNTDNSSKVSSDGITKREKVYTSYNISLSSSSEDVKKRQKVGKSSAISLVSPNGDTKSENVDPSYGISLTSSSEEVIKRQKVEKSDSVTKKTSLKVEKSSAISLVSTEGDTKKMRQKLAESSNNVRKRKSASKSKDISILSEDTSKLISLRNHSRLENSKETRNKNMSNTSRFNDCSSLECKCVEKSVCTCNPPSSEGNELTGKNLPIKFMNESESNKEHFPLTSDTKTTSSISNKSVIDHCSVSKNLSPCKPNHEPELSTFITDTENDVPVSMETVIESDDERSVFRKRLKHGVTNVVLFNSSLSNDRHVGVDKAVQTTDDVVVVRVVEHVKTLPTHAGLEEDRQKSKASSAGLPHNVKVDKVLTDVSKHIKQIGYSLTDLEICVLKLYHVFGLVSALVKEEFVRSQYMNTFIQSDLPRLTGITCVTSQNHLTINGDFLAVYNAWILLQKMADEIHEYDVTTSVDLQPDHDYNQSTKSVKIMWTEPNGHSYELPSKNISKGMYVAKKPTKNVAMATQSGSQLINKISSKIKDGPLKGSNSINYQVPGIKGDNCNESTMLKINKTVTEKYDDRMKNCSDQSKLKSSIIDQSEHKSSLTDQSEQMSYITNQSEEVLLNQGRGGADGVYYVKGFESLQELTDEETHNDSDHQFLSNVANQEIINTASESKETLVRDNGFVLSNGANQKVIDTTDAKPKKILMRDPSFVFCNNQEVINNTQSKETLERDPSFVSNLNDLKTNVDMGKEKLVMITGPFGDKQCIMLTVDDPVKEDLEREATKEVIEKLFCNEHLDSEDDMEHHKTSQFNLTQDSSTITEVNTISGKTSQFNLTQDSSTITKVNTISGKTSQFNLTQDSSTITEVNTISGKTSQFNLTQDPSTITEVNTISGKTSQFNLAQDPSTITEVNTISGNTIHFESNIEISQSSHSDGNVDVKTVEETGHNGSCLRTSKDSSHNGYEVLMVEEMGHNESCLRTSKDSSENGYEVLTVEETGHNESCLRTSKDSSENGYEVLMVEETGHNESCLRTSKDSSENGYEVVTVEETDRNDECLRTSKYCTYLSHNRDEVLLVEENVGDKCLKTSKDSIASSRNADGVLTVEETGGNEYIRTFKDGTSLSRNGYEVLTVKETGGIQYIRTSKDSVGSSQDGDVVLTVGEMSSNEYIRTSKDSVGSFRNADGVLTVEEMSGNGYIRTSKEGTGLSGDGVLPELKCSKCPATFCELDSLKKHVHEYHLMKKHSCGVCEKSFSEKRYLHAHLNRHFGVKKHICTVCGWKFFERHKLKLHMETHKTAEKRKLPYRCIICLHQFHNRASWSDHMNTHTGAKPFACSSCPAKFAHRIGLKRHWLVHGKETPFKCVYCEKGFKLKTKLQDHVTMHTGQGRHSCQVCQKVFTASASLKRHMCTAHWENSSHKETVFMCWKCGAIFQSLKETEEHTSKPCVSEIKIEVDDTSVGEINSVVSNTIIIQQNEDEGTGADAQLQTLLSSLQNRGGDNSHQGLEKSTLDEVEQMKLAASTLADLYSYAQEIKKEKE